MHKKLALFTYCKYQQNELGINNTDTLKNNILNSICYPSLYTYMNFFSSYEKEIYNILISKFYEKFLKLNNNNNNNNNYDLHISIIVNYLIYMFDDEIIPPKLNKVNQNKSKDFIVGDDHKDFNFIKLNIDNSKLDIFYEYNLTKKINFDNFEKYLLNYNVNEYFSNLKNLVTYIPENGRYDTYFKMGKHFYLLDKIISDYNFKLINYYHRENETKEEEEEEEIIPNQTSSCEKCDIFEYSVNWHTFFYNKKRKYQDNENIVNCKKFIKSYNNHNNLTDEDSFSSPLPLVEKNIEELSSAPYMI